MNALERAQRWAEQAVQLDADGQRDDAEIAAYEAGRYVAVIDFPMPEAIAANDALKRCFEQGAADAPQDAADQERAEAHDVDHIDRMPARKPTSSGPSP